jgi:uncharacterized protein (TIGR02271 family)
MSRTVTALFDSREEAENARIQLTQARIGAERVRIVDQSHTSGSGSGSGSSSGDGEGFWSSLKSAFMPEEDSHAYEEGIRRGGYLLCAEVDEQEEQEAMRILDQDGTVDFEQRQQEWRSNGWEGYQGGQQQSAASTGTASTGTGSMSAASAGMASAGTGETGRTVEEERIPLVEEELRVGKREVARGGARVRSYVRQVPVHEQVSLREEHVSVERRPVDQPLGRGALDSNSDMLRERTVEMTETAEEAVVGKEARVREELVLKKTAEQRTEQIDDTVRRTEVDVDDNLGQSGGDRSAFGSFGGSGVPSENERARSESFGSESYGNDDSDRERSGSGTGYSPSLDKSGL